MKKDSNKIPNITAKFLLREKNHTFNSNKKSASRKQFLPDLQNILPKKQYYYPCLGIYLIVTTYIIFSNIKWNNSYQSLTHSYKYLINLNFFFGILLISIPLWIRYSKKIALFIWLITFLIPIITIENTLISVHKFNYLYSIIFVINLLIIYQFFSGIIAFAIITFGYTLNVVSLLLATNESILNKSISMNMIYAALFMGITFIVLYLRKKQNEAFIAKKQELLYQENTKISEELIKALEHQERFIYALDSECIEAFVTLHQIGKELTHKLENAKTIKQVRDISHHFLTILNQNQYAAHYLIQVIYQIKDHLRLDVNSIQLSEMRKNIVEKIKSSKSLKQDIKIENLCNYESIECDHNKIYNLISDGLKYIKGDRKNTNPLRIIFQEAKLEYKISFMKNYSRKIDALKIIITNDENFKVDKKIYIGNTGMPSIILPRTTDELHKKFSESILDAHYGAANTILKPSGNTQIYVIPKTIREVRPKVMDIKEMEIPFSSTLTETIKQ